MRSWLVVLAILAGAADAAAQPVCGTRAILLKQLASEYQEAPTGIGLDSNGSVVELLTSKGGTWTLMVTRPNGRTCLVGTGEAWQPIAPKPREEDS